MARRNPTNARIRELKNEIAALETLAAQATLAKQFGPAAKALSEASRLRTALARAEAEAQADAETDPVARIARLRRAASEAGSWVAASQLAREERELLAKREAEEKARAEENGDGLTDADLIEQLVDALRSLPEMQRADVLRRLEEPLVVDVDAEVADADEAEVEED